MSESIDKLVCKFRYLCSFEIYIEWKEQFGIYCKWVEDFANEKRVIDKKVPDSGSCNYNFLPSIEVVKEDPVFLFFFCVKFI